jgi:chitodextrinase
MKGLRIKIHLRFFVNRAFYKLLAVLLLAGIPTTVFGQAQLGSTNFQLDNINFGTNFTLITGGSSTPPAISTNGPNVVELTHNSVTIEWVTDKNSSSFVEYGTTTAYGQETGKSELVTQHRVTVSGLSPETLYHYRVKSVDAFNGVGYSSDKTFTTPAEAGINGIRVYNVSYNEAFVSWKTGEFTLSRVEYGTTTRYGSSKTGASKGYITDHTVQLTGLTSGTEYHFRIVAENENGQITRSSDFLFITLADPKFEAISASSTTANEAMITWRTNVFTTGIITYSSQRDEQPLTAGDPTLTANHGIQLRNLFGLTQYTFTITATDAQGKQIKSNVQSFSTQKDGDAPKVSNLKVNVTRSGEELVLTTTWKTNEPAKNKVYFNPKSDVENLTELPESGGYVTEHVVVSSGLIPSTPYTLRAVVTDIYGNEAEESINFVTPGLRKSILQLILDSILKSFGWLAKLFEG